MDTQETPPPPPSPAAQEAPKKDGFLSTLPEKIKKGFEKNLPIPSETPSTKNRVVYIILAALLGNLGIHNFYAGRNTTGAVQLLADLIVIPALGAITCGMGFILFPVIWVWAILEAVFVTEDGEGKKMIS